MKLRVAPTADTPSFITTTPCFDSFGAVAQCFRPRVNCKSFGGGGPAIPDGCGTAGRSRDSSAISSRECCTNGFCFMGVHQHPARKAMQTMVPARMTMGGIGQSSGVQSRIAWWWARCNSGHVNRFQLLGLIQAACPRLLSVAA